MVLGLHAEPYAAVFASTTPTPREAVFTVIVIARWSPSTNRDHGSGHRGRRLLLAGGPSPFGHAILDPETRAQHAGSPGMETAIVSQGDLRKWRAALMALSSERAPCPGYRAEEWPRTLSRALDFLDRFGTQAEALGWTASWLFSVHVACDIVRVDHCGALVLPVAGIVRAITATEIRFDHLTHREKPGQPQGVPI